MLYGSFQSWMDRRFRNKSHPRETSRPFIDFVRIYELGLFQVYYSFFDYLNPMDTDYKRIFHLIAKHNRGTDTLDEHTELDNWIYGNTECPRIMFELFIDPQYADALEEIAQSLKA